MLMQITGPACCEGGITGYGSLTSGIVFVGIAPGRNEMKTGRPFTGEAGRLLDALLKDIHVSREDVYCTNLICWFKDDPSSDEIRVCSARLQAELQELDYKLLVPLGALACTNLLKLPFAKARGAVIKLPNGRRAMATYHPAAALHVDRDKPDVQINAAYSLVRDFRKIPDLLTSRPKHTALNNSITYTLVDTPAKAKRVLQQAAVQPFVSLDIETNYDKEAEQEHPFSDVITCIGIGWENHHAYVLTQNAVNSPNFQLPLNVNYGGHNAAIFDRQKIYRQTGVWIPIGWDSMLDSYALDERSERGLHKLKPLSREYDDGDFYEEDEHKSVGPELYLYNAKDVVHAYRVHKKFRLKIEQEGLADYVDNILLPGSELVARSQYRGIYVDISAAEKIHIQFGVELITLYRELMAMGAVHGFVEPTFLGSPQQLREYMGCEGIAVTSTAKAVLNQLIDDSEISDDLPNLHTFLKKLLRYRTLNRLIKVYLEQVLSQVKYDGRVHPHAFLIGTVTGRLTYKDPPMQTLPKPKTVKELAMVRRLFSATNDDFILIEADYAQIEAWIAAFISGDPVLQADLESGNWHTHTTEDVFRVTKSSVDAQQWAFFYDGGKHLNYGFLFGEGPEGLTRQPPIGMGCDLATSKLYHTRLNQRYSHFINWGKSFVKEVIARGYLVTLFGRKRRFPIIVNDHQRRQIINSAIQSPASDYTLTSCIKIDRLAKQHDLEIPLLFIEHDAGYWEVRKSQLPQVATLIKAVMEAPPLPGVPAIKVEMKVGRNLHDMNNLMERTCKNCDASQWHEEVRDRVWQCYVCRAVS